MTMQRYPGLRGPFALALALHAILFLLFAIQFDSTARRVEFPQAEIIEAIALDDPRFVSGVAKLKTPEPGLPVPEGAVEPESMSPPETRGPSPEGLRRAQQAEAEQQAAEELRRQEKARKLAQEEQKEARRKAEALMRKRVEEAKQRALVEAEAKHRAEEEAKRRAEEEARRRAEAEVKRKAEEGKTAAAEAEAKARAAAEAKKEAEAEERARLRREIEKERLAQIEAEHQSLIDKKAGEEAERWLRRYVKPRVEGLWLKPPSARSGMSCKIRVRIVPGGTVVEAHVLQGSGDAAFDRSAEAAVRKASPLPLPPDPKVAEKLRSFVLKFDPAS
jgi:colicin import membrane protein